MSSGDVGHKAVRMAVTASRVDGVIRAMTNTLLRTARSGVLSQARDFSCCILTADARLLTAGVSLPIHVMSGPDLMAESMREFHPDLKPGDAFLHNSPYHGGGHAADHALLVPVFDQHGVHRLTVLSKGHQADIGNSQPSTYLPLARDVYEEGALIFPCVQVQREYRDIDDIIRMCRARIRVPEQWWGDYLALLGAVRIGERRLVELAEEIGWDGITRHADEWMEYSAERMRRAVADLPAGQIHVSGRHDPLPISEDGVEVRATIEIEADPPKVRVDLRGNDDALRCGLNLTESCARTAAMLGVFNSLSIPVPANAGSFRLIEVETRAGSLAGASHPFSCSASTTNVADRLANAIQRGIAELAAGHGLAEAGLAMPPSLPVISGQRSGPEQERFVNQICLASTGGAAGPSEDGWLTLVHVGNGGVLLRDSVEGAERQFPIRILCQRLVPDTEGAGTYRGAPSVRVEFQALQDDLDVAFSCDGNVYPAAGARGGTEGGRSSQFRHCADGSEQPADPFGTVQLARGESISAVTCGGGGYGDPWRRDPARVGRDVREGWVSERRAMEVYAVVLDGDDQPDDEATGALRNARVASSATPGSSGGQEPLTRSDRA